MTNELAMIEMKRRIERTEADAKAIRLNREFWEPTVECYRAALQAMEFYQMVQGRTLPGYAEYCGRQKRVERLLCWMQNNMTEADIEEMLEVYHNESLESLLESDGENTENQLAEWRQERQQLAAEYERDAL